MKGTTMKHFTIVAAAAALAMALPAFGQAGTAPIPSWYAGAGIGSGNLNASGTDITGLQNATLDKNDVTYTARVGWRFHPFVALELGWYDLGKYEFHGHGAAAVDGSARARSVGLSVVGILPIQAFDVYGRLGYARSELKVNASTSLIATNFNSKDQQNEATYGIGARWNFTPNWSLFGEWMKNDRIEVDSYMFGIDYRF
jgi:OOP family OmpA-OmpF porin